MDLPGLAAGLTLILTGAALGRTAWLGSQRRLPRNRLAGIRVRSTHASDAAWTAAHEEAAGPLGVGGGVAVTGGIGVLAIGLDAIGVGLVAVTVVGVLAAVAVGARRGTRAARAADAAS